MTEDRGDTGINMRHMFAHGGKRVANQWATIIGFDHCKTDFTFREIHHLQCARVFNQSVDAVDNQLFWRNQMVDRNRIGMKQLIGIADIIRGADTCNAVWGVEE